MEPVTYGTREVSHITGVTLRQLQWWDETDVLSPVHVKHQRRYTDRDLFSVFLLSDLLRRGFQLHAARRVARELAKLASPVAHRWMLTNGERVVLMSGEPEVIAFLEQRRVPAFVLVSLDYLNARMRKRIAEATPVLRKPAAKEMEFAGMMREALRA